MLRSAGLPVPWLNVSQQDVSLAPNSSATMDLTYNAGGLVAGTYRAQLCLFADYSYSIHCTSCQCSSNKDLQVCCNFKALDKFAGWLATKGMPKCALANLICLLQCNMAVLLDNVPKGASQC